MSVITESLAGGFANQLKRDSHARYRKARSVLDTYCPLPFATGPVWRHTLGWARDLIAPVIYERHTGEKKRAEAILVGVDTHLTVPGIVFSITKLNARSLFKGHEDYAQERFVNALITKHAQCRAMQALGPDVRVYGRELVKHAVVAERHLDVAATFSNSGIALWRNDDGLPTCTTFIPADRLDKWATPYARWQSGRNVDGVMSAAQSMQDVIAMGGAA
jgi:hypothetical protein